MRADDDVDLRRLPALRAISRSSSRRAEPAELGDVERELGHPLAERAIVLLGQDRRRHQHGHLVAAVDRLERGPHRHFGLAEADVAAQQPVHRPRLLHVALDGRDRRELVGRFAGRETRRRTRCCHSLSAGKAMPGRGGSHGLQLEHVDGQVDARPLRPPAFCRSHALPPILASVGRGLACRRRTSAPARSSTPARRSSCRRRNSSSRCSSCWPCFSSSLQAAIAADAVRQVHDVVAFAQIEEAVDHLAQPAPRQPPQLAAVEQLGCGEDENAGRREGATVTRSLITA